MTEVSLFTPFIHYALDATTKGASGAFTAFIMFWLQLIVSIDWHVCCFSTDMPKTWIVGAALIVGWFSAQGAYAQPDDSWDVVLNGRAVHLNATHEWNEDNWGLGFEREFAARGPWVKVALANAFEDSVGDPSYMAGGGLKRRFEVGRRDFYVDVGGVAFVMVREKVNGSRPFPGVLPAATFGFKRVAVNVTYMPEAVVDRVTDSKRHDPTMEGVFFLQLKLDSSLFGIGRPGRQLRSQQLPD